jgi:hypothetical protein
MEQDSGGEKGRKKEERVDRGAMDKPGGQQRSVRLADAFGGSHVVELVRSTAALLPPVFGSCIALSPDAGAAAGND